MSDTRPLEGPAPDYPRSLSEIRASDRSSISSHIETNVNRPMPWLVLIGIIAGISLGLSIGARDDALEAKRIADREARLLRLQIDDLRTSLKAQGINVHTQEIP